MTRGKRNLKGRGREKRSEDSPRRGRKRTRMGKEGGMERGRR